MPTGIYVIYISSISTISMDIYISTPTIIDHIIY